MSIKFSSSYNVNPKASVLSRASVVSSVSGSGLLTSTRMSKKRRNKEPITYYELLELERQKNEAEAALKVKIKRTFPLAPDGFIPNSVVRKFFELLDTGPAQPERKVWKLKWKPADVLKEEVEPSENTEVYGDGKTLIFEWSDEENEEDAENENKPYNEIEIDYENILDRSFDKLTDAEIYQYKDLDQLLNHIIKSLTQYEWFKVTEFLSFDNVIRQLVNQLIVRNSNNHAALTDYLIKICRKFKIDNDLQIWIASEMEEELDATDKEILMDNVKIIGSLGTETYNIDNGLLTLILSGNISTELKELAMNALHKVAKVNENQIEFVLENLKKLQSTKYKRLSRFRLREFINELEKEQASQTVKDKKMGREADNEIDSDTFKAILKEDWVPDAVKDTLKTLRDFLSYLLKSLQTVKSKIFYEKICSYLNSLFNEYGLVNTSWEKQIIDHFINTNTDPKTTENIRVVDMENLEKYFVTTLSKSLKEDVLTEFLRSAGCEKSRPQVMKLARSLLEKHNNDPNVSIKDGLIPFFESRKLGKSKKMLLKYSEVVKLFLTDPSMILEDINRSRGLSSLSSEEEESGDVHQNKKKEKKKKKKDKSKKKKHQSEYESPTKFEEETKSPDAVVTDENKNKQSIKSSTQTLTQSRVNNDLVDIQSNSSEKPSKAYVRTSHIENVSNDKISNYTLAAETKKHSSKIATTKNVRHSSPKSSDKNTPSRSQINKSSNPLNKFMSQTINESVSSYETQDLRNNYAREDFNAISGKNSGQQRSNMLPNKASTWKYYQKRNEREKDQEEIGREAVIKEQVIDALEKIRENIVDPNDENYETRDREINELNNEDEDHADYDYQMYERNEMHSSMNESLNGDDEPNKSKQELRIKSISTRQQHQQPKSLTDTNRINPTGYFDEEFPDEMMGEPSRPVTTFKASSKQILDGMKRRIIFDEMNINNINKNNRPINSPENMMANDVLQSFNNLIVNSNGESSPTNEKGHFIPVNLIKTKSSNRNGNNIRFTNYSYYKKNNDIDYDQLLECLIIRGLELHSHYEKLLPPSTGFRNTAKFIPIPYFKDFLVIQPYRAKTLFFESNNQGEKKSAHNAFRTATATAEAVFSRATTNLFHSRDTSKKNLATSSGGQTSSKHTTNAASRTPHSTNKLQEPTKIDLEFDHLFLIDKLLLSYGAQNLDVIHTILRNSFPNYIKKLHSRIPPRIVPLIWNDPVIQKLALIISTSNQIKNKRSRQAMADLTNNLNLDESSPGVDVMNTNHKYVLNNKNYSSIVDSHVKSQKASKTDENILHSNIFGSKIVRRAKSEYQNKKNYDNWPIMKQMETPRNNAIKKKLYAHLMNVKHEYMKMQWRFMIQENEKMTKSQPTFLPPLGYKATLNSPDHHLNNHF